MSAIGIQIEHGVPMPAAPGWAAPALRAMQPGDSIVLPDRPHLNTLYSIAGRLGCKVTARQLSKNGKIRAWLVSRKPQQQPEATK